MTARSGRCSSHSSVGGESGKTVPVGRAYPTDSGSDPLKLPIGWADLTGSGRTTVVGTPDRSDTPLRRASGSAVGGGWR
jgi:hypothetical protein